MRPGEPLDDRPAGHRRIQAGGPYRKDHRGDVVGQMGGDANDSAFEGVGQMGRDPGPGGCSAFEIDADHDAREGDGRECSLKVRKKGECRFAGVRALTQHKGKPRNRPLGPPS